jgi:hypothetical protein
MKEDNKIKMAVIAGASHALRYLQKNPRAQEHEILQHISANVDDIVQHVDNPY